MKKQLLGLIQRQHQARFGPRFVFRLILLTCLRISPPGSVSNRWFLAAREVPHRADPQWRGGRGVLTGRGGPPGPTPGYRDHVGWKAPPPADPWQDEATGGTDAWITISVIVALIVVALVVLVAVGAVYVYLVTTRGAG